MVKIVDSRGFNTLTHYRQGHKVRVCVCVSVCVCVCVVGASD